MAVTADQEHGPTRLLLAQRRKPERDRAVVRAFLRVLGVTYAEAEIAAPGAAPIDVQFREAHFHLRELRHAPLGRDGQAPVGVPQSRGCAHGDPDALTEGRQRAVLLAYVTAVLAPHAAWYGARCTGLDALVVVEEGQRLLAPPPREAGGAALPRQGWRSVSVWWPPAALVLYAVSGAPAFLRAGTDHLLRHGERIDLLSTEVEALTAPAP